MKLYTFIVILIFNAFGLIAQPIDLEWINKSIGECITKNYKPNQTELNAFCREGSIFIKFKVNDNAEVTELAFSKDAPAFIVEALTDAIDSLSLNNALMIALQRHNKVVIQPVFYSYKLGCNFPKVSDNLDGEKYYKTYLNKVRETNHYGDLLFNMLNFSDGKLKAIDCIFLSPIGVAANVDW
jgi:hypothetical protein